MRFRVFVVSSVLLFISAVLAIWVDFDREWKHYQKDFNKLEYQVIKTEMDDLKKTIDSDADFKKLEQDLRASEEKVNSKETISKNSEIEKEIKKNIL